MTIDDVLDRSEPIPETGCWLWLKNSSPQGYGWISRGGKTVYVHRAVVEMDRGPIPDGLEIDHRCGVRRCVNPRHLDVVTHQENIRRTWARVVRCPRGHPFDEENTMRRKKGPRAGERWCRACNREWQWAQRLRAKYGD